jgi:hypothetical protein
LYNVQAWRSPNNQGIPAQWRTRSNVYDVEPSMKALGQLILVLLAVCGVAIAVATPLLGVWLASSLVSFEGGPRVLALVAGVLFFPVLPVLWELRATRNWRDKTAQRRQFGVTPKRKIPGVYRLVFRTLALNLAFLAVLMVWFPKVSFTALATRGDWFLDEQGADGTRKVLFAAASGLEWLHQLANPNPYKKKGDDTRPLVADVTPTFEQPKDPIARRWIPGTAEWKHPEQPEPPKPPAIPEIPAGAAWTVGDTVWPQPSEIHPAVAAADETSIESVGRSIAARESDPFKRVKALHDWVVTRLTYDDDSLQPGARKPQDPASVFARRNGVCEGYARLLVELGNASGDRIVYVTGDVREENGAAAPIGHAWNAAEIRGKWYLIDATWDDPRLKGRVAFDNYRTDYLFIPPSVAIFDHLPDEPRWQLLPTPLSRGDFIRQPLAGPGLSKVGLTLTSPDRSVVEVTDHVDFELLNPRRRHVMITLVPKGAASGAECGVDDGEQVRLRCNVPDRGNFEARVFTNSERFGVYDSAAMVEVVRR